MIFIAIGKGNILSHLNHSNMKVFIAFSGKNVQPRVLILWAARGEQIPQIITEKKYPADFFDG